MEPSTVKTRSWKRRSPEQWRDLLERFEQSGQTREQFCSDQGLVLSSFDRWRRKLRQELSERSTGAGESLFVELTPQASPSAATWDVELQLGAGVFLRLRRPC